MKEYQKLNSNEKQLSQRSNRKTYYLTDTMYNKYCENINISTQITRSNRI